MEQDRLIQGMAEGGDFRIIAAQTTHTVETARQLLDLAPVVWWLVPAPDFNRLTSRAPAHGGRKVELHFRAHPWGDEASTDQVAFGRLHLHAA